MRTATRCPGQVEETSHDPLQNPSSVRDLLAHGRLGQPGLCTQPATTASNEGPRYYPGRSAHERAVRHRQTFRQVIGQRNTKGPEAPGPFDFVPLRRKNSVPIPAATIVESRKSGEALLVFKIAIDRDHKIECGRS